MSGHSKFSNIKHKKEKNDAAKGKIFTIIGREIAIAVKEGGPDPDNNSKLRDVIAKAKSNNMPNDTIERGIKKAAGDVGNVNYERNVYEGYGPSGVAIIVQTLTDNKNRTMPEVRHTLEKNGGRMADPGSVMFQFTRKGVIFVKAKGDEVMMAALDAGAEDVADEEDGTTIYTAAGDLAKVRSGLIDAGYEIDSAELQYVPNNTVPVDEEASAKVEKILDAIDDLDDVVAVHTNAE